LPIWLQVVGLLGWVLSSGKTTTPQKAYKLVPLHPSVTLPITIPTALVLISEPTEAGDTTVGSGFREYILAGMAEAVANAVTMA
jgi:hypothetical protein